MKSFIRSHYWFGWWWASICSKHRHYNNNCGLCNAGTWTRVNHNRLFGKDKYTAEIDGAFIKYRLKN